MPEIFDKKDHKQGARKSREKSVKSEPESTGHRRNVDDYSEVMRHEKPHRDRFSWYIPKPIDLAFSTQAEHERLIMVLRQHPATQIKWILLAVALMFMPFLFIFVGFFDFLPDRFYFAGFLGWYLMTIGYMFEAFLKWYYNVYIITDERIIDIDFNSLINRDISAAKTENIEDVTASSSGILAAIFDYGDVRIQTAGEKPQFEFPGIPYPNRMAALINELILEEEREKIEGRVR